MIKISIIIPVYNSEKYIRDCLESVLKQTYTNYEVICIDDGSNDNSRRIIERYVNRYDFIRIICHNKNCGLSAARNTGLMNSYGKYVLFLDSDDMIISETLEELIQCAENNQLDNIYFNMKKIYDPDMEYMSDKRIFEYCDYNGVYSGQEMLCHFAREKKWKEEVCRQFYRKEFLLANGISFYEGILHEDILFSFLCMMKAERVMNINKEYYIYRQHKGSIMYTMSEHRMKSLYIILMEIFKYWTDNEFSDSVNEAISYYFETIFSQFLYNKKNYGKFEELKIGSYAEKYLYTLITGKNLYRKYATLSSDKIDKLKKAKQVILFGAGRAANDIVQILQEEKINIFAVTVSDVEVASKVFCGYDVVEIEKLLDYRDTATVIIGTTNKYGNEIKAQLLKAGFKDLIVIDECDDIIKNPLKRQE